ncbi:FRIGIDA-like protein 5 [Pyrus communis]|uniref:FRIGIDA-like protein 5 n=1 Tax=Pyrus communis TaxID=23211 RepID=UPI0035C033D5
MTIMEEIASKLKLSETKQRSVGKSHEILRAQADSMLAFTLNWKDLDDHFDSVRNSLYAAFVGLLEREKEIGSRFADLEVKEKEFDSAMAVKGSELQGIVREVEEGKSQLQSIKLSFEKYSVEEGRLGKVQKLVKGKEMEYYNMQQRMKELSKEIEAKERQLNAVRVKVVEQWKEFDLRDDGIRAQQTLIEEYDREVKSKEQKLGLIEKDLCELEKSVGEWDCKVELKQLELKRSVQKAEKQFESKSEELNLIGRRVNDCLNDVQLKEKKLDSREKHLDSLDKSIQEFGRRLEQKAKELELKQQEFESKAKELDLIDMRVNDCLKDVQLKEKNLDSREKHLDSLDNSIQECGRRLEQKAKELELNQQEFEKSKEEHIRTNNSKEKTDILHTQVKTEQSGRFPDNISVPPLCATNQSRIIRDGRSLQFFMNEYFRRTDSVSVEVSACLQLSSDPAKLVLDAMQGFYPSSSTVENREFHFDLSVIRRSCIHLLKEVKRVSPKISDQVRAEAKKLAGEWRARMTVAAESWLEVLGFLWLVTAYDLTSISDSEELQSLLRIAANHEKQSDELYGILDTEDKTPASSNLCSSIKTEKPESSLGKNAATCSSPNLQLTATSDARNSQGFPTCSSPNIQLATTDARNLQQLSNEQFSGNQSIQNEFLQIAKLFSALDGDVLVKSLGLISQNKQALEYIRSSGFGDKIPDAIPTLIERRQRIEAVRAICTFNLIDKFPPVPLLKEHVDTGMNSFQSLSSKTNLVGEKIKIAGDYMADLRAVIQCIKDYNLESAYPPSVIETKLAKLQNLKDKFKHTENWRSLAPCHKVEQKQKGGRKRSAKVQAQQLKFKRQRAAVSAPAPHPIPNPTPGYAPPNLSYVMSENGGHPWQFGMAGCNVDISKGICYHCNGLGHWKRNCPKYLCEKKNGDVIKSQMH